MSLSLAKSSLPIDGMKGVFTNRRVRKGEYVLVTDPTKVKSHDLLRGVGRAGASTLSRWDPIFDLDTSAPLPSLSFAQQRQLKLARMVQHQPLRRPLVLFSQERFLALRHTWTSDRHLTMFMPHLPAVEIVLPAGSLELSGPGAGGDSIPSHPESIAGSQVKRNDLGLARSGTAALNLDSLLPPLVGEGSEVRTEELSSELIFEVNDPYPCQLPDPDDVANPTYWRGIKQWLGNYSQTAASSRSPLFDKAGGARSSLLVPNVQLVKLESSDGEGLGLEDDDMMPSLGCIGSAQTHSIGAQYALMALRDIPSDSELFLSYGADWWRQRLLSSLLLSAESPSEMGSVRWIERLCAAEGQEDDTFPYLTLDRVMVRDGGRAVVRTVLWDALRQERAPTQAVIAYAVRQSCVDGAFAGQVISLFAGDKSITVLPALRRLVRDYLLRRE